MSTAADLSNLQNLVKRDPEGYRTEFLQQYKHFVAQYEIFQLKPNNSYKEFLNLVKFIAAVAPCYPDQLGEFPSQLCTLLERNALSLHADLRKAMVKALILLRNRNLLSPTSLLSLFFKLFHCPDKALRLLLRQHIISDISRENRNKKNIELNNALQNFMYKMFQEDNSSNNAPREALSVMVELFRKHIWNDKKTVNVISLGIFSKDSKMVGITLNFFLTPETKKTKNSEGDSSDSEDDKVLTRKQVRKKYDKKMTKNTRSKKRKLDRKIKENDKKRKQKLRDEVDDLKQYNHAALILINDPQSYAEKVFGTLKKTNAGFDMKLGLMNLISRLVTANCLLINNFYSYMQKYAQPHQQKITQILAITAQSVHSLVSPDIVLPLMTHIANTFVTDRRPTQVIAIGLNTIREICLRSPLVMTETLLKDLIQYRHSRDRGVSMAAKSLVNVFRAINPSLLPRKERGKEADINVRPADYGEVVNTAIEGTEFLDPDTGEIRLPSIDSDSDNEDDDNDESGTEKSDSGSEWEIASDSDEEGQGEPDHSQVSEFTEVTEGEDGGEDEEDGEEGGEDGGEDEDGEDTGEDGEDGEDAGEDEESGEEKGNEAAEGDGSGGEGEGEHNTEGEDKTEGQVEEGKEKETEEKEEQSTQSQVPPQPRLEAIKILSQEDWEKLKYIQENKEKLMKKGVLSTKRKATALAEGEDVDEETIIGWQKKRRVSKEEKKRSHEESRKEIEEERKKFTYGSRRQGASSTNIEKKKTKPYAMLRQKALKKQRLSAGQKLKAKEKHVRKQASQRLDHH